MSFCLVGIFKSLKKCNLACRQIAGEVKDCGYIIRSISDSTQQLLTFSYQNSSEFMLKLVSSLIATFDALLFVNSKGF